MGRDEVQRLHRLDQSGVGVALHRRYDLAKLRIGVRDRKALVSCLLRRVSSHVNESAIRALARRCRPVANVTDPVSFVDLGGLVSKARRERVPLSRQRRVDAKFEEPRIARLLSVSPSHARNPARQTDDGQHSPLQHSVSSVGPETGRLTSRTPDYAPYDATNHAIGHHYARRSGHAGSKSRAL